MYNMNRQFLYALGSMLLLGLCLIVHSCTTASPPSKAYRIARDVTWYPLHLMGKDKSLLGFTDDLIVAIATEEKIRVELVSSLPSNLMSGLDNGNFDAVISLLQPTPINKEEYIFSDPFFLDGPVLVVPLNSSLTTLVGNKNKELGIQSNSSLVLDIQKYPLIDILSYDSVLKGLDNVANGGLDGFILEAIPAYFYTSSLYKGKLKISTAPLTQEGLRLMTTVDPEGQKLIADFNDGLKKMREKGVYAELIKKWGLFDPEKVDGD